MSDPFADPRDDPFADPFGDPVDPFAPTAKPAAPAPAKKPPPIAPKPKVAPAPAPAPPPAPKPTLGVGGDDDDPFADPSAPTPTPATPARDQLAPMRELQERTPKAREEPPKAAKAKSNPFDADDPFAAPASPAPAPAPAPAVAPRPRAATGNIADQILDVTIGDAEMFTTGGKLNAHTYMRYFVNTKTNLPRYKETDFTVKRRYRDFVWLAKALSEGLPGYIVPALPPKALAGNYEPEFVEYRKKALQHFMDRCITHPTFRNHPKMQQFLESTEELPSPKDLVDDAKEFISRLSLKSLHGALKENEYYQVKLAQAEGKQLGLNRLTKASRTVSERQNEVAVVLSDCGKNFTKLAEGQRRPLGEWLAGLGNAMEDTLMVLYMQAANQQITYLAEPFTEYGLTLNSVRAAIGARAKAYIAWQDMVDVLAKTTAKRDHAERGGGDRSLDDKVKKESTDCQGLKTKFEEISDIVHAEVERYEKEHISDIKGTLLHFVQSEITQRQKVMAVWSGLLQKLQTPR